MKKILIILLSIGVLGGSYGFYMYNKPSTNVGHKNVDVVISAPDLVNAYKEDEDIANSKYLNKVILVSGVVKYSNTVNETQIITIETDDLMSSITCEMSKSKNIIKSGDEVVIKGQCAGYLLDVVLTKCVLQN